MTNNESFGRDLSRWLHEEGEHRVPDHLAEVLVETVSTRQRPWWSSPERWLPMQTTLRLAPVPRIAWGLLVVLAVVLALGVAVLAVGSQHRLPPPFGLARNGVILYGGTDNDIHTLDPTTGATTALIAGSPADHFPWLSPDGNRFFFLRDSEVTDPVVGTPEPIFMVADIDGSDVRPVSGPLVNVQTADWSHDGSRIVVSSDVDSKPGITILTVDGSTAPLRIDTQGMVANFVAFRPGDRELTFRGSKDGADGIYAVGADGTGLRTIRPPGQGTDWASLSPDGTKIAYHVWTGYGVIHVVNVDSGQDSIPALDPAPTIVVFDESPVWSPDSKELLFDRYTAPTGTYQVAIAPAAGGHVVQMGPAMSTNTGGAGAQFSPDGTKVIAYYYADKSTWMLDPSGLTPPQKLSSTMDDISTWQRLAP